MKRVAAYVKMSAKRPGAVCGRSGKSSGEDESVMNGNLKNGCVALDDTEMYYVSFGTGEKMTELLDIHPGAVRVMGLMNDHDNQVQLLVDEDVLAEEYLGVHPCVNTSSLKLRGQDVWEKFLPAVHHEMKVVHLTGI